MMNNTQSKINKSLLLIWMLLLLEPSSTNSDKNDGVKYSQSIWDSCKSHRECKNLKYTECYDSRCQCVPNYELSKISQACVGKINATCDSDIDCQNRKEVGCIFNTCQRYSDFFTPSNAENIKLYHATGLGARCETDENCNELYNTVCKSGKCNCASGYREDNEACKQVRNATCTDDYDCKERGTKCLLNNCILPADFFAESNSVNSILYAAKNVGDFCQNDNHCRNISNSQCYNGACICTNDSMRSYNDEQLGCKKILNTSCRTDFYCTTNYRVECYLDTCPLANQFSLPSNDINNARCFLDTCLLPTQFFVPSNTHNIDLYSADGARGFCQTDRNCRNAAHTHCVGGRCECLEGFLRHDYRCYELSDLSCTNDVKCEKIGVDIYCLSNLCQNKYVYFQSTDIHQYRAKWFNGYCEYNENCIEVSNTECSDNRCKCKEGYTYEYGECNKDPPTYCSDNRDCRIWDDEYCLSGLCQTPSDFFRWLSAEDSNLYAANRIYGVCQTDHHCRNLNNTYCLDGQCSCLKNWEKISDVCQQTLGITCSKDSDCPRSGTRCMLNTCLDPEEFFSSSNDNKADQYAAERVGERYSCRTDYNCRNLNNTHCTGTECACIPGFENVDSNCQKAINVTCSDDSDCLLPRSYCFLNTCLYPEDFLTPSNGYNTSLYAAKRIDGFCQTDHHCREFDNSRCFRRRCSCKNGYFPKDNRCVPEDNKSVCPSDYIEIDRRCKSKIGGGCRVNADCGVEYSTCDRYSGICACYYEFQASQDKTKCRSNKHKHVESI